VTFHFGRGFVGAVYTRQSATGRHGLELPPPYVPLVAVDAVRALLARAVARAAGLASVARTHTHKHIHTHIHTHTHTHTITHRQQQQNRAGDLVCEVCVFYTNLMVPGM
jgi:hypothetical protein